MLSDRKISDYKQLKIVSPKQMLQALPIVLAQVNASNTKFTE